MVIAKRSSRILTRVALGTSFVLALTALSTIPPAIAAAPNMHLHPVKSVPGHSAPHIKRIVTKAAVLPQATPLPASQTYTISTSTGTVAHPVKTDSSHGGVGGTVVGPWQPLGATGIGIAAAAPTSGTQSGAAGDGGDNSTTGNTLTARILSSKDKKKYGVTGFAFELSRPADASASGPIAVQIPEKYLVGEYGANYAARISWQQIDANDTAATGEAETPVANVVDSSSTVLTPSLASSPLVIAAVTSPNASNGTGSFAATPLNPGGSWGVSAQTGDFNWAMPLRTPPAAAGPSPTSLALNYDSQSMDGLTGGTNNQSSSIGMGWSLAGTGNIQRRYVTCSQDNTPVTSSQDLCWSTNNATLTLDGHSSEIVRDNATGQWKLLDDDGTKITHLTNASGASDKCVNGTTDTTTTNTGNECWVVTTTDGTQYFFGLNHLPGWVTGDAVTNSTWTVPVYGNDAGEPCHASTFAASMCTMAWQWNLDYVVDVHGNQEALYYNDETDKYDHYGSTTSVSYVRGGSIKEVDYGVPKTDTNMYATNVASDKVLFSYNPDGRCSTSCTAESIQGSVSNPAHTTDYPDVPWDLNCTATTCPNETSPSFWTDAQLATVTTDAWQSSSSSYTPVDTWTLSQTFVNQATDPTNVSMWLNSVAHRGTSSAATEPATTFTPVAMQNRVWASGATYDPLWEDRISSITTSLGAQISVTYSGQQCAYANKAAILASAQTNQLRCFPEWWSPTPGAAPIEDLFNKYVVTSVVSNPETGGGSDASLETDYVYTGHPAWRFNMAAGVPKKYRTWSDYEGFDKVTVNVGTATVPNLQKSTQYTFFQGMNGNPLNATGSSLQTAYVDGTSILDQPWFAGRVYESQTYDGSQSVAAGAVLLSTTVTTPWAYGPTATPATVTGEPAFQSAYMTGDHQSVTTQPVSSGGTRTITTNTTYSNDAYNLVTQVETITSDAGDTCTTNSYAAPNTTAWIIGLPSEVDSVAVACANLSSAVYPADAISDVQTAYDGLAVGASPTMGAATTTKEVNGYTGSTAGTATWITATQIAYDALGRPTLQTDVLGHTTTTAYTPSSSGPLTSEVTTNTAPFGWTTTTAFNPDWGLPVSLTDPNGRITSTAYDGLGRVTGIWKTDRSQSTYPTSPSIGYAYTLSQTSPNAIETSTLGPSTTLQTFALYDGLGRQVQSQTAANGGGSKITDTVYDSAGNVSRVNNDYWASGVSPSTALFVPTSESAIASEVLNQYDGAGRITISILDSYGVAQSSTTTAYEGADETDVTPPTGGTPESTYVNSLGEKTKLVQYLATTVNPLAPPSTMEITTYGYDPQGAMTSMTDPEGNEWTWQFNVLGQQTSATDPDTGTSSTTYDAAGDVLTTTDARGVTLAYAYDALQRKTGEYEGTVGSAGSELATWAYDPAGDLGQLASSTTYSGSVVGTPGLAYTESVNGYDTGYRPTGETLSIPSGAPAFAGSYSETFNYGSTGYPSSTVYPAEGGLPAETLRTAYNGAGEATGLGTSATSYGTSSYNPLDQVDEMSRVGQSGLTEVDTAYGYASATNDVAEIKSTTTTGSTTQTAEDNNYSYGPDGNVTSIAMTSDTLTSDTQCFQYDYLQNLTEAWTPGDNNCTDAPSVAGLGGAAPYWDSYTVDPATGNRQTETLHGAAAGGADVDDTYYYPAEATPQPHALQAMQQTVGGGVPSNGTYAYDADGDMTTRLGQTITYDPEGRVSTISDGTNTESDMYDADGNLLLQTESATGSTLFDGADELHVATGSSTVTGMRSYSLDGTTIAERTTTAGVGGSVLTWLIADAQGTVNLEVDAVSGTLTYRAQDPFGNSRGSVPTWTDDRGFLDGPLSSFSGLTQLGARVYDPTIGKFTSVDAVLDPASPAQNNGYAYAQNSPVDLADPNGLDPAEYWHPTGPIAPYVPPGTPGIPAAPGNGHSSSTTPKPFEKVKCHGGGRADGCATNSTVASTLDGLYSSIAKLQEECKSLGNPVSVSNCQALAEDAAAAPLAPSLPLLGGGVAAAEYDRLFATAKDEAVFYTAIGARGSDIADSIAQQQGGKTLGMLNDSQGNPLPAYDPAIASSVRAWELASQSFARRASGEVSVVLGPNVNPQGIWARIELPALNANPRVTAIRVIDPITGQQTALWVRGG
jgi:RHS repeat-associated protein